jgi:putative hydrolase of the HAD superfamily
MTIRAVLFDVGGPLDTEVIHERLIDQHIREAVAAEGYPVTDEAFADANDWAVASFAWNAYQSIIWRLTRGEVEASRRAFRVVAERGAERRAARNELEPRPGIAEVLRDLHDRGLRLGLAANQPVAAIEALDRHSIGHYFHHREVSGHHGLNKPDPRLFLRACHDLGVSPGECIMVGDRIDNDIVPARWLGMRTVLFRTGRHIAQQPRSWLELPDAEVEDVPGLARAIDELLYRR